MSDLKQCGRDADLVESCLLESHFCSREALTSLRDPSRDQMFDALENLAKRSHGCDSCLILLYYAGHSYEDDGMIFMCPSSSKRREDDISLESFIQRLSDHTTLLCVFASCQANMDLLVKEPVFRPSVAFPKQWHTRATARLRDMLGRSVRCRMFMLFGCHPGKELPDDGLFTAVLIKHMRQRGLDVQDMARAVTEEVRQATESTEHRQWPLSISNLDKAVCLLPAEPHAVKKVNATGLLNNLEVQRYVGAVCLVTPDGDPDTVDFNWACTRLCGLPRAAKHYRRAQPLDVLQICNQARMEMHNISDDDIRAARVPALMLLSYLDELEARLMIVRGECELPLPSSASQVARLEYGRCVSAISSFLDKYDFDDFIAAKALLLLQLYHQQVIDEEPSVSHYSQAKFMANQAAPLYKAVGLPEGAAGILMDCSWGAVQCKLLDRKGMQCAAERLERLMHSFQELDLLDFRMQYYQLVASTQLVCLYKGLQDHKKASECLPKLKQALAHPKQWLSRACKARNLSSAWDIQMQEV